MAKATFIYQELPGEKVKIFSPVRGEERIVSTEEFEDLRNNPKMAPFVHWMEYTRGDVGQQFQTDTITMDLVNVDGVRVMTVREKQA